VVDQGFITAKFQEAQEDYKVAESIFNNTISDAAQEYAFQEMRTAFKKMNTFIAVAKINERGMCI
jgi:hypothetical protein